MQCHRPLRLQLVYLLSATCTAVLLSAADVSSQAICGRTPIEPQVNTGRDEVETALPHSWPWVVTLCSNTGSRFLCHEVSPGHLGAIVGRRWVLTNSADNSVRAGTYNWYSR